MVTRIVFFIFLVIAGTGFSQISIIITANNEVLPYAKISYQIHPEKAVLFSVTDLYGKTSINAIPTTENPIYLQITAVGYQTVLDTLIDKKNKNYSLKASSNLLDEICVTGEYTPTLTSQSVNKIKVIHKEDILKSGASTLNEILTYQANIRIQQDNILGAGISMSGMSGENVKILQDGVPVIGRLDGNIDLSQINLDNIEKIEIVNGPLSVNYGTNALAGTINIITKKNLKNGWNGNMLAYYESVGNYNLTGNLAYTFKKQTLKINGGRKYFDGWDLSEKFITLPQETLADTNRAIQWNPKEQYFGDAQLILNFRKWQINPYFRYYQEKIMNRGFPNAPYLETAFDDYYYTKRIDQGINLSKALKNASIKGLFAYNYFNRIKNTYFKDLTDLSQVLTSDPSSQDTSIFDLVMARVSFQTHGKKWINYQVGTDINIESTRGKKISGNYRQIGDYAIFSSAEINLLKNKAAIKPGLRYAYNTVYKAPVTPSINVKYNYKKFQLRASVASGFRAPTLKELYYTFVDINHNILGNTALLPEKSQNYSGSIDWTKPIKTKNVLKFSGQVFYNTFSNLITLGLISDGSYTYINIGDYATRGANFEGSYRQSNFKISTGFGYIGRYNAVDDEELAKFIYSPEMNGNLTYNFLKNKYNFNIFYKYNGPLLSYSIDSDDNIFASQNSGYSILDVSVSGKFLQSNLSVTLGLKNLLNVTNIQAVGSSAGATHSTSNLIATARGRSVFLSINYNIKGK
ncbi:MAG: TonB-dependent receptor [Putridiphycobacter sp.]|nr:TonB-dependent receptor [Putridiphycobacter sp.]